MRWDEHSTAGRAETYRITTLYDLPRVGGTSTAPWGPVSVKPPWLRIFFNTAIRISSPEQSKGWDVGWRQEFWGERVVVDATYFRNDFEDLIVFDFTTFSLDNVGLARSSGVEVVADWQVLPGCWLNGTYTRTDTRNLDTGNGNSIAGRRIRRPWVCGSRCWGGRPMSTPTCCTSATAATGTSSWTTTPTVNLAVAYRPQCQHEWFARLDNLFDTSYQEVAGYGVPGISAYGGVRLLW